MPLTGIKVLDLSRVLAGPYCAQILGDLGADVIKVEPPKIGDDTRHWGEPYYLSANRNKRGIALDFKSSEDLRRTKDLASRADVIVENFKTDGLKKFGLDYETLKATNPRLIYCSITGFGHTGPRAHEPGYDFLIQGIGGMMSITGPDAKTPTKVGVAIVDLCTGLYAATAILAALRERDRSGIGQHIDLSLLETQASLMSYLAMNYLQTGKIPVAIGNKHPSIAPYECFPTKDDLLIITIGNNHQFEIFSKVLGEKWFEDPQFQTNELRIQNRSTLSGLIAKKLKEKSRADWMDLFKDKGFPFGPVESMDGLARDPQVLARNVFNKMDDGKTPNIQSPIRFSRTPITQYRRPPKLDEDRGADFRA